MIELIYQDAVLYAITRNCIEDEGVEVHVGRTLLDEHGDLNCNDIVILKPDVYYSTSNGMLTPPKSIDNLVVTREGDSFCMYLMEMKSSSKVKNIVVKDIVEKFGTIVELFLKQDFSEIFQQEFELKDFRLWLICNPFTKNISEDVYRKKIKGCGLDAFQAKKPYSYKGKRGLIVPMKPNLTIENNGFVI